MAEVPEARVVRDKLPPRLEPPPRKVPATLVWRLLFGGIGALGWFVATVSMVAVLVLVPRAEIFRPDYDRTGTATITRVEETSSSEGSRSNARPIHRVHFTFVDDNGTTRTGASYTTYPPATGDRYRVEWVAADPSKSRLVGMRARPFDRSVLFMLLFPIVGLGLAFAQLFIGIRAIRLLRTGLETRGKLVAKQPTGSSVNNQPVMALTFEFQVGGHPVRATVTAVDTSVLEDDELEPMLYDPRRPTRATTLDHLPGSPKITEDGRIIVGPGFTGLLVTMPVLTIGLIVATVLAMR